MADIQGIYNRLNSSSQYTPLSAETFGDWSMEAGDLVTVVKDGRSYVTPIMQGDLKWDGASKVTIESVGNREREPLGRMSRRKYSGGGGGYWNSRKAFTRIEQTDYAIVLEAQRRESADSGLSGRIDVQADRISLVVEGTGANAHIKPAEIVAAINNGESSIKISADHIVLDGDAVASSLEAKDLWVNSLNAQSIETTEDISCLGDLTVAGDLQVSGYPIVISDITVSGNTMTISYADGREDATFSKAVSFSGDWNGNVSAGKSYKYTATQNGVVVKTGYSPAVDSIYRYAAVVWDDDKKGFSVKLRAQDANGTDLIEEEISFDTSTSYTAGRNSVTTITPTAVNVYTSKQGTLLSTRLSASILTSGKYITFKVGSTTYSIQIT